MIIQIGGIILLTVSLICGTWYAVKLTQMKTQKAEDARKRREERNERIYNIGAMSLYEEERQRRIDLETRLGIVEDQLRRAREQMAKVSIKEVR